MAKPASDYSWSTDAAWSDVGEAWDTLPTKTEPTALRASGYLPYPLAADHLNWQFNAIGEWLDWLESQIVESGDTMVVEGSLTSSAAYTPRRVSFNGATGDIDVNTGGDINIETGGELYFKSGGQLWFQAGAVGTISGDLTFANGSETTFANGSVLVLELGAVATVESGATVNIEGALEVESGGVIETKAGASALLGGTTTNAAAFVNSGTGRICERVITGANADTTYSGQDADVIVLEEAVITAPRTYTLRTGATVRHGERIKFLAFNSSNAVSITSASTPFSNIGVYAYTMQATATTGAVVMTEWQYSAGGAGQPAAGWYLVNSTVVVRIDQVWPT